ncbi:hypothetical protein NUH88_14600 [Nisaea acidiphila]|uniref:Doubled CXXCH motif domain-containing protein n=1 Tax=Nisaea acidiphila TaxID=1862145 RepID=A0A9J7ALW3_9PROT|nr:hypothetical protein [Nisaea acidiphila]UUX48635.1 hypothetical protein NUH88_14600 [Nisaea acidiphila]
MDARITTLTRRAKGGIGRKEELVSAEVLRIGRGSDNEIYLPDPRVPLHLGAIHLGNDGLFVEAVGSVDLRLNGAVTRTAHLKTGDTLGVGPYEIVVEEPPEGLDLALTHELTQPLGDDLEELRRRSCLSVSESGLGKRKFAWVMSLAILVLFLALPVAWPFFAPAEDAAPEQQPAASAGATMAQGHAMSFDISWLPGEMMNSHKFFADNCTACHKKPFVMVEDEACASCHTGQHAHAMPEASAATGISDTRCATCHTEHNGPKQIRSEKQRLCASCHGGLDQQWPETQLINAADFGTAHPQFKATVWTEPSAGKTSRVSLDDSPKEVSNLRFPHKTHLDPTKMKDPETGLNTQLECASCHVPEAGKALMQPVAMETHCGDCHRLTFDKDAPKRTVSHGKPGQVYRELQEFYAARALEGGVQELEAPAVVRRRPGTPLSTPERLEALAWSREKADWAARYLFSKSQCGSCHVLTNTDGPPDQLSVEPAKVAKHWFPKARFDHGAHKDVVCSDCHVAADSMESSDVLLPKIAVCRDCHGGEAASDRVPSPCVTCHAFHLDEMPPMHPARETAAK